MKRKSITGIGSEGIKETVSIKVGNESEESKNKTASGRKKERKKERSKFRMVWKIYVMLEKKKFNFGFS